MLPRIGGFETSRGMSHGGEARATSGHAAERGRVGALRAPVRCSAWNVKANHDFTKIDWQCYSQEGAYQVRLQTTKRTDTRGQRPRFFRGDSRRRRTDPA
jgi:hypothetical protein